MKLPIYNLEINEDDDSGIEFTALVDKPAIERNWMAFNEQIKFAMDEEQQVITGALMIADLPIYRNDRMGEYYAMFSAPTINKIVKKAFRTGKINNVNLMHDQNQVVNNAYMFESFIINSERGIYPPKGFEGISEGSWFGSFKIDDAKVWQEIKDGKFKGFSIEGAFEHVFKISEEQKRINEIINIIDSIK